MKYKAIIVDDEARNRNNLSKLLSKHCLTVEVTQECASVDEAVVAYKQLKPDMIFLDIEMPKKDGFKLLEEIPELNSEVIFVTAYNQYALKAFNFSATHYILKPIETEELMKAVAKAEKNIQSKEKQTNLSVLLDYIKKPKQKSNTIALSTLDGIKFAKVETIIRCESDVNYTTFYFENNEKIMVSRTLKEYEETLTDYNFYRIHNSHLINIAHVKSVLKEDGGYVIMTDNAKIEISRRRKDGFMKHIEANFI